MNDLYAFLEGHIFNDKNFSYNEDSRAMNNPQWCTFANNLMKIWYTFVLENSDNLYDKNRYIDCLKDMKDFAESVLGNQSSLVKEIDIVLKNQELDNPKETKLYEYMLRICSAFGIKAGIIEEDQDN